MTDSIYLKEMGQRIKAFRTAKGLTVRQLGKMCNLDFGYISRLEGGQFNPHVLTLKTIAGNLNVDVKDFL
jgi:transcriptional regulator with XRE-family HTH domain